MKTFSMIITAIFLSTLMTACGCSTKTYKQGEADAKKPVNCATGEGDIRVLESEKSHASQQMAAGITAIIPISLVVGVATDTEGTKAKVATGEYNKMLDKKITEIKQECGIE